MRPSTPAAIAQPPLRSKRVPPWAWLAPLPYVAYLGSLCVPEAAEQLAGGSVVAALVIARLGWRGLEGARPGLALAVVALQALYVAGLGLTAG